MTAVRVEMLCTELTHTIYARELMLSVEALCVKGLHCPCLPRHAAGHVPARAHSTRPCAYTHIHPRLNAAGCRAAAAQAGPTVGRAQSLCTQLRALQGQGVPLCRVSQHLLACSDDSQAAVLVDTYAGSALAATPFATCMASIAVATSGPDETSTVVVGHEAGAVCLIDNRKYSVAKSWHLGEVPAHIATTGALLCCCETLRGRACHTCAACSCMPLVHV